MYKGILHTHTLVVLLFVVLYLVKTFLLVTGKNEQLERITSLTKWPERIISVLFLGTGIYLYLNSGNITWMVHVKIFLVFASIPMAVVGFKRKQSFLAVLSMLCLLSAYGLAEMNKKQISKIEKPVVNASGDQLEAGKLLYGSYCQACHGEKGDAGLSGAKNLQISTLTKEEKATIISKGKGSMPGFSALSTEEVNAVIQYTETFSAVK